VPRADEGGAEEINMDGQDEQDGNQLADFKFEISNPEIL
jgi:hypothetical protein